MDSAVFDTNVLIYYANGRPDSRIAFRRVINRYISLTTWIEFLVGVSAEQRLSYESFLKDNFEIIETDFEIADFIIDIRRSHKLKLPDATIYATAKHLRAPLVTYNTKDFDPSWPDVYVPGEE